MQEGYVSCSGCGCMFKRDSVEEMMDLHDHDCATYARGFLSVADGGTMQ